MFEKIEAWISAGLLGVMGIIVRLLHSYLTGAEFSMKKFILHICVSFMVGIIAGEFITDTRSMKNGVLAIVGMFAADIMNYIEKDGFSTIIKILNKKFGIDK